MNDNCCLVEYKCRVVYEYCVVDDKCYIVDDIFSVVDDKCCVIDEESCVVDDKCCVVDEEVCAASCVRVRSSGNQGVVHCFAYKYIIVYQFINLLISVNRNHVIYLFSTKVRLTSHKSELCPH